MRESKLRQELSLKFGVDQDTLEHLITHVKIKLSSNVADVVVLRLLKYDEYTQYLALSFLGVSTC